MPLWCWTPTVELPRMRLRRSTIACSAGAALQASDVVANPDASTASYLLAVANLLENDCFYAPKSVLGLAVLLRGTGMAFHRSVLLEVPWRAQSIVEDMEYTLRLLEAAVRIWFVPEVRVTFHFPVSSGQLRIQRERWIGGGVRTAAAHVPRLFWKGLTQHRLVLLDAALTMMVVSRPVVIAQLAASLLISLVCWWAAGPWASVLVAASAAATVGYAGYAVAGVVLLGIRARRIGFILRLPFPLSPTPSRR